MKKNFILFVFLMILNMSMTSQNANDYYTTAVGYIKLKKYDDALLYLDKTIKANPELKEAYFAKGFIYYDTGKTAQSIEEYNKAIKIDMKYFEAYYHRGLSYYESNTFDNALNDFTKALELDDQFFDAYNKRANIYYLQKKYDLAINDFDNSIKLINFDYYSHFLKLCALLKISKDGYFNEIENLKKSINKIEDTWQKIIASFLTGVINDDKFISESKNENEKLCEAYFYIGIDYLSKDNKKIARNYFNKCIKTGLVKFTEYKYAQAELSDLK